MLKPFFSDTDFSSKPPQEVRVAPNCNACGLYRHCRSPKMPVAGKGLRKILIIGEAPGEKEDEDNLPFVGPAGRLLQGSLKKFGVDMFRDCWVINAARCRPPKNKLPSKAPEHCRPLMIKALDTLKPELVIPLGKVAVSSLLAYLWRAHDLGTISKWAGWQIPSQKINAWVCPNLHPSHVLRGSEEGERESALRKMFFERWLGKALELEGRPWSKVPDFRGRVKRILDHREAARLIRGYTERGNIISFDYENTTLKPDSKWSEIVSCSVYDGKVCVAYPWVGEAIEATRELLISDTPKIGANLKHEEKWTIKEFGHGVNNWDADTVLAAHTLDSRGGTSSVKFQAFVLLGMDAYDEEVKPYLKSKNSNLPNRIKEIPVDKLLTYNGLDSVVEYHIAKLQMEQMGVSL